MTEGQESESDPRGGPLTTSDGGFRTRPDGQVILRLSSAQIHPQPGERGARVASSTSNLGAGSDSHRRVTRSRIEARQGGPTTLVITATSQPEEVEMVFPAEIFKEIATHVSVTDCALTALPQSNIDILTGMVKTGCRYKVSRSTLSALCSTSHTLRRISMPLLYQFVSLSKPEDLDKFVQTLVTSYSEDEHFSTGIMPPGYGALPSLRANLMRRQDVVDWGYGQFVKRLDLWHHSSFEVEDDVSRHGIATKMQKLISYCPHLEQWTGSQPLSPATPWISSALIDIFASIKSLRLLSISIANAQSYHSFMSYLADGTFERLHVLRLRVRGDLQHVADDSIRHITLPELGGLCVDFQNPMFASSLERWSTPRLKVVYLSDCNPALFERFAQFIERHSDTVCSVALESLYGIPEALQRMIDLLPHLEELCYNPFLFPAPALAVPLPSLTRIGWSYTGHDPGDRLTEGPLHQDERHDLDSHLNLYLSDTLSNMTELNIVGDYSSSYHAIPNAEEREWWAHFVQRAAEGQLSVLDCMAMPIVVGIHGGDVARGDEMELE